MHHMQRSALATDFRAGYHVLLPSIHPSIHRQATKLIRLNPNCGQILNDEEMTIPSSRREDDDVDDNKPWCIIIKHPSSCLVFFFSFILTIDPITCCSYSRYCSIYGTIKRSLHSVAEEEDLKVILNGIRKSWNVLCLWSRINELKPFNIIIHRTSLFYLFHSSEGSTHHCPCHQRNTNTFPPNPIDLMWFIN